MSRTFPPDTRPSPISEHVPESPYMGLMPYSESDAPFFFGREKEIKIVIANIMASKLTVLYGTSGVGKSSMLRAGVVHQLQQTSSQDLARHRTPEFLVVYFSEWSNDPIVGLANGVRESIARLDKNAADAAASVPERGLAQVLHQWSTALDMDLFIVLDQFEEYFLYHSEKDGPGTFAVEFPRAIAQPDLRVNFLVALREDSLAKLDRFKGRIPNLFGNYLRIRHLDVAAARMAVEKPLEEFNRRVAVDLAVTVEPELREALLEQVRIGKVTLGGTGHGVVDKEGDSPTQDARIETPYLQLVLERLWSEELKRGSRVLRATTLRELGGAQRIVRTHLDEALANLQPPEQVIAARIFHYLVTPSGMKISHTVPDLAEYAGLPEPRVTPVLKRLSGDVRILRPVAPALDQSDAPSYEIFHDVLAPAILDWRARYQEVQAAEARLAKRLESEAEEKRAAEERAQAFRRRARITRTIALGMAFLLFVMTALATIAWRNWSKQRALAQAGDLTAHALSQASSDPAESLRLAAQGFDLSRTKDGEYALRQALSASRTRLVLQGHKESTTGVALSGDGKDILTVSDDHTARIWEASSGRQLAIYDFGARPQWSFRPQFSQDGKNALLVSDKGKVMVWPWQARGEPIVLEAEPADKASAAAFSPDPGGDRVVVGYTDGQVRVWTWHSPGKPVVLGGHTDWVNRVAFSPDGSHIATVSDDKTARVWDWRTPNESVVLRGHRDWVVDLAFSPDGRLLATASWDQTARIWEWRSSKEPVIVTHDNWLNTVKFSRNGKQLVTASGDSTARVWDSRTGKQLARLDGQSEVIDASFSPDPDGALVVTAELDARARVWEASTAQSLMELLGHSDEVRAASFSPDGRSVVTASADNTARVWDVTTGRAFRGHDGWVLSAAFNDDGSLLVTASGDETARVWDARTARPIVALDDHQNIVRSASFSSDGRLVVTASDDGSVGVWEARTGKAVVPTFGAEEKGVRSAAFSPNGRFIVSVPWRSKTATVWDWQSPSRVSFKLESNSDAETGDITSAVFSPDNRFVLTAHESKIAQLWELGTGIGSVVRRFVGHQGKISSVAFSRDGARAVTASADRTARVWDTRTGKLIAVLQGPTGSLRSASFDPDGELVVAGSDSATAIWKVDTKELLGVLRMHAAAVNTAAFSPDGKLILTASDDRTAKLYPCEICVPAEKLLDLAGKYQRLNYLAP